MDIQILAPIPRVLVANRSVDVGSPKTRLILAVLAESVGRVVPAATLIEHVWGQRPPDAVRRSLHSYVSRIRRRLKDAGAEASIVNRSQGYALEADPECVDWHRARQWSDQARKLIRQGEVDRAAALLEDALALWQGDPFTEFSGLWSDSLRRNMGRTHIRFLGQWAEARLALGQHGEVLDRLDEHPKDERLVYLRMCALNAAGRDTEAVSCYTELRERRRKEEGVEPNQETQHLFQVILAQEQGRPPKKSALSGEPVRETRVHDTLHADIPHFVGREAELATLLSRARRGGSAAVVQAITGMGGTGKSTLAVHAAHLLRDEFDVRLQVNLRGSDPQQALFRLLLMLGVPGQNIPPEPEARRALWHDRLAGRRVLLVLDDAKRGQVGPIIPGIPDSVVLVTSRQNLTDLNGEPPVKLGTLSDQAAVRMFAAFTGFDADADGMARAVALMRNLPIALRVASGYLQHRPNWTPSHFADRMADRGRGSARTFLKDVTEVFALSYDDLSHQAQRTFLRIGLHPTTTMSDWAAAAAVGSWDEMEVSIDELLDNHLVEEVRPGVLTLHDFVRDFAVARAAEEISGRERDIVLGRILDYYLAVVDAADRSALPHRYRLDLFAPRTPALPLFQVAREANEWFASTYLTIEAVVGHAHECGFVEHVARMPLMMAGLLDSGGPWGQAEEILARAVGAWRTLGHREGLAHALYELGCARARAGHAQQAEESLQGALAEWRGLGDQSGVAYAQDALGHVRYLKADYINAISRYRIALEEFGHLGDQRGKAKVLNRIAAAQADTGSYGTAIANYTTSKALYGVLGDRRMEAYVMLNLTELRFVRGEHRDVRRMSERCLRVFRESGDAHGIAQARHNLGTLENYMHRYAAALACFEEAHEHFRESGDEHHASRSMAGLGTALLGLGQVSKARETVENALIWAQSRELVAAAAPLLRVLGDVLVAQQRLAAGRWHYRSAKRAAVCAASKLDEGLACARLGDLSRREGDEVQALALWGEAAQTLEHVPTPYLAGIRLKIEVSMYADMKESG